MILNSVILFILNFSILNLRLFFDRVFIMSIVFHDIVDEVECLFPVAIAETDNRIPIYFRLGFMEHEIIHVVIPDFGVFPV